jgi:hypothetical protein
MTALIAVFTSSNTFEDTEPIFLTSRLVDIDLI